MLLCFLFLTNESHSKYKCRQLERHLYKIVQKNFLLIGCRLNCLTPGIFMESIMHGCDVMGAMLGWTVNQMVLDFL